MAHVLNGGAIWGTLDVLFGVVEFEDEFLRGVECNIPKKCCRRLIFGARMWEKGCGPLDAKSESSEASFLFSRKETLGPPLFPFLGRHPPSPTLGRPSPSPLLAAPSPPMAAALYPLHGFLLPLELTPSSKDREEEEQVGLKRKRGPWRCSIPISSCILFWGNPI
jgi:hypothetical protein